MAKFQYAPMFQLGEDKTEYYKIPGSRHPISAAVLFWKSLLRP